MNTATNERTEFTIVDGHVHIYDCFDLNMLLDSAYNNFAKAIKQHHGDFRFTGLLLLTETSKEKWFYKLREMGPGLQRGWHWRYEPLPEDDCALLAQRNSGESMFLIAGQQLMTAEGLELLALVSNERFSDGMRLSELLPIVQASNAIPVIPWGVGKWLGRRGRLLRKLLQSEQHVRLFLGDNGGRPRVWSNPLHFQIARNNRIEILSGTDPLPLPSEASRVGSFGFTIRKAVSTSHPAKDLRRLLNEPALEICAYGQLERIHNFLHKQVRIRMASESMTTPDPGPSE